MYQWGSVTIPIVQPGCHMSSLLWHLPQQQCATTVHTCNSCQAHVSLQGEGSCHRREVRCVILRSQA